MEDREYHPAIFSTENGKYAYREARHWVRPIFREDYRDDVEHMAQRIRQEFPQECKPMTALDAGHVGRYFDAVDIQMQTRAFLYEVLIRIVCINLEEAQGRVHEYVHHVLLDPVRYEGLTVDDSEIYVFTEEERGLVGYDNTLPAALIILKRLKFPSEFNGANAFSTLEAQTAVGTDNSLDTAASNETLVTDPSQPSDGENSTSSAPAAIQAPLRPRGGEIKESSGAEQDENASDHSLSNHPLSKATHPIHGQPNVGPNSSRQTRYLEPSQPDEHTLPTTNQMSLVTHSPALVLEKASSEPVAQSYYQPLTATRRDCPNDSRAKLEDRFFVSTQSTHHPLNCFKQDSKGCRQFKEAQPPAKKTSNGIRRKSIAMKSHSQLPQPFNPQSVPVMVLPSQPLPKNPCGPLIPDRISSVGFSTSFAGSHHQRTLVGSASTHNSPSSTPYYPRPESFRAQSETGDGRHQNMMINARSLNTRALSYSFHSAILEDSEGERASVNHRAGPFIVGYKGERIPQYSTINQDLGLRSSCAPETPMPFMDFYDFVQYDPQSSALSKEENHRFPSQHGYRQLDRQNNSHNRRGCRNLVQDRLLDRPFHRQSFSKDQSFSKGLTQPHDDCVLFVSGFPEHLDAKAIWQMLSPVHGLKWVAPIKKAQNERGHIFTNIVFHEPFFAAEALDLLPRTMFAAMNGRFLNVRRFSSEQARPVQYWDPGTSTRSRFPVHPVRRSSESAFPAHSQATHPYHSPGHQSRLPASTSYEKTRTYEFVAQNHQVNSQFDGDNDHPFRSEADKSSGRALQENCAKVMLIPATSEMALESAAVQPPSTYSHDPQGDYQKAMDGRSTASTGSPIKRVKRKAPNSPNIGRIKAKDSTKIPSKELAEGQSETPEEESQELAEEALEIAAAQPRSTNVSFEGPPLEAAVEAKQALPDGPETLQPAKQEVQPRKADLATQLLHSTVRHSTEKVKTPTKQSPMQLSQAYLSPQETVGGCERSVPFLLLPEATQNDLMQAENTLLQPTGLKPLAKDADTPEQDFITNEVAIQQGSNANTSRKTPFSTKEQQLAAEASQRQFAAVLVQTQTMANNSKVQGKGQRPSMALKATNQQPTVKSFVGEPAGNNKRHLKAARVAKHPQHPATEMAFHESLPASATEAQHRCPIDIGPDSCAHKDLSSSPDEDISSRSVGGTPPADGELIVTKPSLRTASPNTCLHKQDLSDIGGHDTHTTRSSILMEYNNHKMPPAEMPNTTYSHEKLVITNVQPDTLSRSRRASFNGQSPHLSSDVVDLTHASLLPIEKAKSEEKTSMKSQTSFKKSAFGEQQTSKNVGSCLMTPKHSPSFEAMHISHKGLGQALDVSYRGHKKRSTAPAKELTKSISRSEHTILSDKAEVAASETSHRSPDRRGRLPVPPRSSSIVQLPTSSSPILTRKKKQKKFSLTSEEQQDMNVPKGSVTSERGELPEADLMLIAQGGSRSEQELDIVTDASGHYPKPPYSSQSLSHAVDILRSSRKTETTDTESTLTSSTLFVSPPETLSPQDPSSSENTPLTPVAVVSNPPGTLKESSSLKSNNRKKNRPGKKKSKSVRTLPLDYNVPVSTLLDAASGSANPEISLHDCVVHCILKDSVLEQEELQRAKQQTTEDDKWRNAHGHELNDLKLPHQLSIKNYAEESSEDDLDAMQPIDFDQANLTAEDQDTCETPKGLLISDTTNGPFLRIARDLRYPSAARIPSRVVADRSMQILGDNGFNNSICAGELRPCHSIAAMKRIQELCEHESQTQDSLRLERPLHIIDHSTPEMNKVLAVTDSTKNYKDDPHKDRIGHLHSIEKRSCLESKGIECAAVLDFELRSIIREAVQMTSPFPSDKKDLEKGIFYTLESVRVKRILKVTDFREVSPLNFGHDRDRRWISEWCDEVTQWIHYDVPRMTELQKKDMEKWEMINPSMEMNLMALGFTTLEIHQCVLNQTPKILEISRISASREHELKSPRSRPRSAFEDSDVKPPFPLQVLSHAERKPHTKIHPTATAIDCESESDSSDIRSGEIGHVESGSPPAIDMGGDDEVKELISSDKLRRQQTLNRGNKAIADLKSKPMKLVAADDEELDEVHATCKFKLEKVTQPIQEKEVDFPFEEKKAMSPKDHCDSSSPPGDDIIDIGLPESSKLKTVADQLSIAAAIKQNEKDLQGKSLARKYKKVGQGELQTLGLLSSPLKMTTSLSSTLSESFSLRDSPKPEVVAQLTTRSSKIQQPLTPITPVPFPTPDASLTRETSLESQEPLTARPSYATALQSPIVTPEASSQGLCTSKPTYAIVLQASDSRCKEPTDTDAWALPGEEAWGIAANNVGGGS